MNKGIYFASFTALLWGFLAIAIKVALNFLPAFTVIWLRFVLAFAALVGYYIVSDREKLHMVIKPPRVALFAGIFLGLNYLGYITGIQLTSPSIGQVFIQTGTVMLAVAGFVFFKEKVSLRQGMGLAIVLAGLVIFYHEQIVQIAGGLTSYKTGVLLVLFGAISWTLYAVFQKVAVRQYNPMQLNLIVFGFPALLYSPLVNYQVLPSLSFVQWFIVLFLGFNTLAGYVSLAYAFKYLEANKISAIIALNPLITFAVMAWLSAKKVSWISGEVLTPLTIAGAFVVIAGILLTVLRKK